MKHLTLFNHSITLNKNYSAIALCLTQEHDVIQLSPMLKKSFYFISNHYDNIGLKYTRNIIWDTDYSVVAKYSDYNFSFFMYSKEIDEYYNNTHLLKLVNFLNSKNSFLKLVSHKGLMTPKTSFYSTKMKIDETNIDIPIVVKKAISSSGRGVYICDSKEDYFDAMNEILPNEKLQLQEKINTESCINIQFLKDNISKKIKYQTTKQILNGTHYQGSEAYETNNLHSFSNLYKLASHIFESGMIGVIGFDILLSGNQEYLLECNPRYNGATYPSRIASFLNITFWSSHILKVKYNKIENISLTSIEYNPSHKKGVIIYNWGQIQVNRLSVMIIGSLIEQQAILKTFKDYNC